MNVHVLCSLNVERHLLTAKHSTGKLVKGFFPSASFLSTCHNFFWWLQRFGCFFKTLKKKRHFSFVFLCESLRTSNWKYTKKTHCFPPRFSQRHFVHQINSITTVEWKFEHCIKIELPVQQFFTPLIVDWFVGCFRLVLSSGYLA